jgi:fermentation-respiration switch protein FrsA (DUF1100 family)
LLILFVAVLLLWFAASLFVAYRFTRRRERLTEEPLPAVAWAPLESLRLTTRDGETLGVWYHAGQATHPVVLVLHGNGARRSMCLPQAELLASAGCGVLLVTLRAHGDSTGEVNDFGLSARNDVIAAVEWLEVHAPGRRIVVWGQSLGAAAALFAAGELGERVRGYLFECPYRDVATAVRNRTRIYLPPLLDVVAYVGLRLTAPLVLPDCEHISPRDSASEVPATVPVLLLAGSDDRHARPDEARDIQSRLTGPSELVVVEGGGHLDLARADAERYRRLVLEFVTRCGHD